MITTLVATLALAAPQDAMQDFRAQTLDGKPVAAHQALQGTPSMLILWGPWSPQSSKALEAGIKMRDKYGASLKVVALTSWDTLENTTAFLQDNPRLNLVTWWDPAGKSTADSIAMKVFKVRRFPSVFILDKQACIVGSFVPYKSSDDLAAVIDRAG